MNYPRFRREGKRINEEKPISHGLPLGFPSVVERSQAAKPYFASSNPSSSSCASCVRITCDDWDKGGIFDWYRAQPHANVCRIELRKERENFKHEFILVFMDSGRIYRIERRPLGGVNPDAILLKGAEAEDAVTVVGYDGLEVIHLETDAEIILSFNESKPDLYAIIAICVAIHLDPETTNYTLEHYNCYFLARTIIALISRYCLLQACSADKGLRWDCITKSAISCHIFGEDWNKLRTAIRMAMATRIEKLLLDTFKRAAGTIPSKGWNQLKSIVRNVVYGKVVMRQEIDVDEEVQRAVNEWILDATEVTLWYGNLEQHLSKSRYAKSHRTTTEVVLTGVIRSILDSPDKTMERSCGIVLECCTQKRPVGINMSPELLARIPAGALDKLSGDLLARLPCDTLQAAPTSFLERLPINVYSRMSDPTIVTLPNDLSCVPSGLLDVALERMQRLLDQPDNPDRICAVRLLHQLPKARLEQLSQRYIAMRNDELADEVNLPIKAEVIIDDDQSNRDPTQVKFRLSKIKKLFKISIIGFLIRVLPIPVLRRILPLIIDFIPQSSFNSIPKSVLARIPPEHLATLSSCVLDKLPEELLSRLPESLLMRPQSLQERLCEVLVQRIPQPLLNDLPEDLTSLLRQAIRSNTCEGDELREELRNRIWVILKQTLFTSCGEIPTNILQVRVPSSKVRASLAASKYCLVEHKAVRTKRVQGQRLFENTRTCKSMSWI